MTHTAQFLNSGRADRGSQVQATFKNLRNVVDTDELYMVEIDEGDKGYSEKNMIRELWPAGGKVSYRNFPSTTWQTHEPILIRRGVKVLEAATVHPVLHTSVPHQSPNRPINRVRLEAHAGYVTHFAAGAYNGERPPDVKKQLIQSWQNSMHSLHAMVLQDAIAGVNVLICSDTNRPGMNIKDIHPRAEALYRHGPDFIIAVPASKQAIKVHKVEESENAFEGFHKGVTIWFDWIKA